MKLHVLLTTLFLASACSLVAADAKPITVQPGKTFTLSLDSNPTTGYRWQLAKPLDEQHVKLITNEYQRPATRLMGAGGKETWTFKALTEGNTEIHLKYVRPWQTNSAPARTTHVLVTVGKSAF